MYLTNQRIDFSGRAKRVVLNSGRSMKINSVSCLCLREHIKLSFPVIMNTAYAQQPPLKPTPQVVVGTTFFFPNTTTRFPVVYETDFMSS